MKKGIKLIVLSIMLMGLTGCINFDGKMKINKDKSMEFSIKYGIDMSALEGFGDETEEEPLVEAEPNGTEVNPVVEGEVAPITEGDILPEVQEETELGGESEMSGVDEDALRTKLEPKGFTISEYTEDKISGVTINKTYKNIDNISKEGKIKVTLTDIVDPEKEYNDTQLFQIKKGLLKDTYKAYFEVDFTSDESEGMDLSSYESLYNLAYSVELPSKAVSSNATTVSEDGKTLSWKFEVGKVNAINFEFAFVNNTMVYVLFGVGSLLLLTIIVLAVRSVIKDRKSKNNNTPAEPVVQPTTPEVLDINADTPIAPEAEVLPTEPINNVENIIGTTSDAIVLNQEPVKDTSVPPMPEENPESLFPKE